MDSNRDKAIRAQKMANIKMSREDFHGAKEFVDIAQEQFPSLKGLSQMLNILEVLILANKNQVPMDWYGILQVDPGADDNTIRKQYRRLALVLHPDKNAYPGAEKAFKLIAEGLCILSDKQSRAQHDSQRQRWVHTKGESREEQETPPATKKRTGDDFGKAPKKRPRGDFGKATKKRTQDDFGRDTSWRCTNCKCPYDYQRYLEESCIVKCYQCGHNFIARGIQSTIHNTGGGDERKSWEHMKGESQKQKDTPVTKKLPCHHTKQEKEAWNQRKRSYHQAKQEKEAKKVTLSSSTLTRKGF